MFFHLLLPRFSLNIGLGVETKGLWPQAGCRCPSRGGRCGATPAEQPLGPKVARAKAHLELKMNFVENNSVPQMKS